MPYINYVEFNVGDVDASRKFYKDVFGWDPQPWGEDYYVAAHGDEPGVDTGMTPSPDGEPVTVAVITVDDIAGTLAKVLMAGGDLVVPAFDIPDVGKAAYFADTNGLLVGLHERLKSEG
jgi:predicted enzyme related to lactoylglutathione lyase